MDALFIFERIYPAVEKNSITLCVFERFLTEIKLPIVIQLFVNIIIILCSIPININVFYA